MQIAKASCGSLFLLLAAGCASPGPPLPPSLKLPQAATGLNVARVGDSVTVHWQVSSHTTDKLLISGEITAEVCRDAPSAKAPKAAVAPCTVVQRLQVQPGKLVQVTDPLPPALLSDPPHLLAYRVRLLNGAGRGAAPAGPVFAASGAAPPAIEGLAAKSTKTGVVLEWKPQPTGGSVVELDRTALQSEPAKQGTAKEPGGSALFASPRQPAETRLKAGDRDAGGTVDRTAEMGQSYSYTAWRVRTVKLSGQTLELRSAAAAPVTVAVRNVFPPEVPAGLVAAPGFVGEGASAKPTIDLSWEADMESHLAGYRVYRRDLDAAGPNAWKLLTPRTLGSAAFSDDDVEAGKRYAYRVTGVSDAGVESAPSAPIQETAQAPQ